MPLYRYAAKYWIEKDLVIADDQKWSLVGDVFFSVDMQAEKETAKDSAELPA